MAKVNFALPFLAALFLTACQSRVETVEAEDSYGYTERYSRNKEDFGRHGLYEKFTADGQRVEEAHYVNDTLHGQRVLYSESGDTQVVETYRMGLFEGPFRAYYEGNQVEQDGQYEANVMYGQWKRYYPSGQLMETVTFADNEENGPFVEYYENGKLKAEGTYRNGDNEHGLLKLYNEAGELIRTMNCEDGVCRTIWKAEKGSETAANDNN